MYHYFNIHVYDNHILMYIIFIFLTILKLYIVYRTQVMYSYTFTTNKLHGEESFLRS